MAENDLKSFDYDAFAKDLAGQASQVVPRDVKKEDKDFTIEIIYRFCKMAGEALTKEENSQLNAQEASLVTQFIGEWIFHKSIDIIRAGIEPKYRESILQKIAFTVFDTLVVFADFVAFTVFDFFDFFFEHFLTESFIPESSSSSLSSSPFSFESETCWSIDGSGIVLYDTFLNNMSSSSSSKSS